MAMRSATSKTSFRLWEIMQHGDPLAGQATDQVEDLAVWATPRAAVGSSMMTSWRWT